MCSRRTAPPESRRCLPLSRATTQPAASDHLARAAWVRSKLAWTTLAHLERGGQARSRWKLRRACWPRDARSRRVDEPFGPRTSPTSCQGPKALARESTRRRDLLGPYSPVAVGDYAAGPLHVLPRRHGAVRQRPVRRSIFCGVQRAEFHATGWRRGDTSICSREGRIDGACGECKRDELIHPLRCGVRRQLS